MLRQTVAESPTKVVLLGVLALVEVGTTVLLPAALAGGIDAASTGRDLPGALVQLAVVLTAATATDALSSLIGSYYGSHVTARLRHRLLGHVLALGVPGQRRFPAGDLLSRLTATAAVPASFVPMMLAAGSNLLVAVGAVVGLALIDLRLAGTFLLGVPVAIVAGRVFVAKASEPFLRYQQLQAAIMARLLDAHRGVRTVRASGTANREIRRILEPLPELHDTGRQIWARQRQVSWQLSLLTTMLQVLMLMVGGFVLTAGHITPGELVAAAAYVGLALGSVGLFEMLVALLNCQMGAGRVSEVLETELAVSPPLAAVAVPSGRGRLELHDVSVRMGEQMVLNHLNLSVPPGTSMAVVGRSGAGKSTLVSLVGRLLDPDEGEVLLDGIPVSQVELEQLRQAVTYAFERPALLGSCVHDMIAYARPTASRAEVEAAARAAQADRFIRLLPEGYDTPLPQAPMSGGELQRLGLARAILTRARVIVLDDATSSLDTATEMKVADALERVLAGRTSLIVAHRAATAARADLVAWLDTGRIRAL
ncbi:MAG: ABC transporter ATP-binding protein/permease, partial [Actinomycetota bacterium]|nr:ABC transporter ATP-binding protein/permease [Actinomycetota bacterium]